MPMIRLKTLVLATLYVTVSNTVAMEILTAPALPVDADGWTLLPPPRTADGLPPAEVIDVPASPNAHAAKAPPSRLVRLQVPGFKTVLAGALDKDIELTAAQSPVLIHGVLLVPTGRTLTLRQGVVLRFRSDPKADAPKAPNMPDPRRTGILWVNGRLLADGLKEPRVQISAVKGQTGSLSFSGAEMSELRGADVSHIAIAQPSASVQWLACKLTNVPHYALAGGAAFFIHCSIQRCGGIFTTYHTKPWALLVNRCTFDACREGLVFGCPSGNYALFIERNAFTQTSGAILRALPDATASKGKSRSRGAELLIGENWYGTAIPEQIDARIIDRRSHKGIRLWLNTRPPAEQRYADVGAQVPMPALARALKELEPTRVKMLKTVSGKKTVQLKP